MKQTIVFLAAIFISSLCLAKSDTVEVAYNKTVHLFFEGTVKYFDVGSPDVMIDNIDNIVKLKAAITDFPETNLTIITASSYYHFILKFNEHPRKYTYTFESDSAIHQLPKSKHEQTPESDAERASITTKNEGLDYVCKKLTDRGQNISDIGVYEKKISFVLEGIFVDSERMYFVIKIKNNSNIKYDIDFMKFVKRNKRNFNTKKYAIQEEVMDPAYEYNQDIATITPKSDIVKVFVFEKFTIADDKKFYCELWEKGGERNLEFSIDDNDILNAKLITPN